MKKEETLRPIEDFCKDPAIHNAVCLKMGWAAGKAVTREEYDVAVDAFLNAPAGSYRRKK